MSAASGAHHQPTGKALAGLAFGALGVVYGDIGTSPLYAIKECFGGVYSVPLTRENVLGILSLVFWSLNLVVSYKYVGVMLRADNRGEGGILALMALADWRGKATRTTAVLFAVGLFGAALLYGDGIITPAISVLGAIEGLGVVTHRLEPWIIWISLAIIVVLFSVQHRGTAKVGMIFGPVTMLWFACIAVLGIMGIAREPGVLSALNPIHAAQMLGRHGLASIVGLASVVLVVTGGEALYADMGHFGRRPIRVAWFLVVLPALLLNYFGQGAQLLHEPSAVENPFYSLVPRWALIPMVVIATGAAITASQALISGAFSLTQQAIQLGYCPRLTIVHTSRTQKGQIYMPGVNWGMGLACVGLIVGFKSADSLAAAYGVAVTGTMTVTTLLFAYVARTRWRQPVWKVALLAVPMLVVDLAFAVANLAKLPNGGWFPLVVAGLVFALLSTWKRGRNFVVSSLRESALPLDLFIQDIPRREPVRVAGTAIFLTSDPGGVPPVMLHHLKHNKVLHERVVILSLQTRDYPTVPAEERLEIKDLGYGIWQVVAYYGFMETPDMHDLFEETTAAGLAIRMHETSFFLGRETLLATGKAKLARWRKQLYIVMARNAQSATAFFNLPPNRVVELGAQIQI
jgi:KUP system potassium uptake protein